MFRFGIRLTARRSIPSLRLSTTRYYNYSHFQTLHSGPSKFSRFIKLNLWIVSCTAFAYYMWWPKHTFPSPVAKHLRKGLWAESDKGEKDYQLALKHYLEALEECGKLKVDPLSDEYTGIQLKIGEMYERMDRTEEAAFIYNEIATLYLSVLKAAPNSPLGLRIHGSVHRAHLIQKDLRIALKLVELNRLNPLLSKAILITHLLIAQEEVNKRLGAAADTVSLMDSGDLLAQKSSHSSTEAQKLLSQLGKGTEDTNESMQTPIVLETNPEAWEPFTEEFFNAMDILSAICISVGDVETASGIRISMASKMLIAGVSPERLILAQCNTASLLYFQAEQLQAQELKLRKQFAELAEVDHEKLKSIHDHLHPLTIGEEEAQEIKGKINDKVTKQEKEAYEQIVRNKDELLKMVVAIYESVIEGSKQLPQEVVQENTIISESVALATYGLGVVNLHLADYDIAERFLREARVRSRRCGYDALITEIERELNKLFEERKLVNAKKRDEDVQLDIHFAN
ncbi:hypothetical protein PUMCH_000209 [Australozyma saopauloensis]|uniref:Mitochondrial inner membrane i-AAA protease supercomplex subunit MGR3 n=1 Tax=Australozyma saopauloensis TaxID=291208 RepID=A0AAX4H466_9ASCO|nr:hypothetical protein PUMCH_000209 [[Candida] saopauloensis]